MTLEEELGRLIRNLSDVRLQNCFMRLTDRESALSLSRLEEEEKGRVLSLVPPGKKDRILEEMSLLGSRIKVPKAKYEEVCLHVVSVLRGRGKGNISSYLKPRGR